MKKERINKNTNQNADKAFDKKRKKTQMLPVCRKIAAGKLREHKLRSLCMIAAVMLTSVLFTAAFSAVFYFQSSIRQAEMENAAWTAHGAVADVTDEQYEAMRQSSFVSEISCYRHLGFLREEALDEVTEMQYCEKTLALWMYYEPVWGRMPQSGNEIMVSAQLLENMAVSPRPGEPLSLHYEVNGILKEGEFILSGAYEQKPSSAAVVFISESFCEQELLEASGDEKRDSMLGARVAEVMFRHMSHMERDMRSLLAQAGAQENKWMLNPAFAGGKINPGVIFPLTGVLLLIMACGYFIIYNIFNISVMQDTRFYGSLAMLGFYGWEVRKIVKIQTDILCAIAIPAGFVPGAVLSAAFLPELMQSFGNMPAKTVPNPVIFAGAALFSYLTVQISSRKPARIASKIAPVTAKRYMKSTAAQNVSRHGYKILVMAWKNMTCGRKKSLFICCSMILCIVLASLFYTVSGGLNLEIFLKDSVSSDFIIGSSQYFNRASSVTDPGNLDNSLLQKISQWDGIEASGGAGVIWMDVPLDAGAYKKQQEIAGQEDAFQDGMMHDTPVYGIDEHLFRTMEVIKGSLDWDKFKTGKYIVASGFVQSQGKEGCFEPGDKVKLEFSGRESEYTVMAVGNILYDFSVRSRFLTSVELYLPRTEWEQRTQSEGYYMHAYDIRDENEAQWEENLSALKQNGSLFFESKMTFRRQFEAFASGISILGISIGMILGCIGLMNFINVIYSSIYERKRELAVLQSMGMSLRQVYGMLSAEGGFYMLVSWLGGIAAGAPLGYFVLEALGREMQFFQYQWRWEPYLLFGAAGCVLAVCVPCLVFRALDKREGLLYRLRHE